MKADIYVLSLCVCSVIILHEVAKAVAEYRKQLSAKLEVLPDYYTARAGAVEKIATRVGHTLLLPLVM